MPGGMSCLDEFQTSQMNSVMDPTKQTQISGGTPYSKQNEDVENPSTHKDLEILQNYRQTKAFQTLMRRQAQAVRKITRIKETFTKKREQITMLNVAYKAGQSPKDGPSKQKPPIAPTYKAEYALQSTPHDNNTPEYGDNSKDAKRDN